MRKRELITEIIVGARKTAQKQLKLKMLQTALYMQKTERLTFGFLLRGRLYSSEVNLFFVEYDYFERVYDLAVFEHFKVQVCAL